MSTKNDEMILKLKATINAQKEALAKAPKTFQSKTSTILMYEGEKKSLRTMTVPQLHGLKVMFHSYAKAAVEVGLTLEEVEIYNFSLDKWIDDVDGKIAELTYKDKAAKLAADEKLLNDMLSDDKRTELLLAEMAVKMGLEA